MGEIQQQIIKEHKERQEKFVYYLIALAVSCLGFAVYNTLDAKLKLIQIPLGLAVLSWGISVFCGIKFLKVALALLYDNSRYFDVKNGQDSEIGNEPASISYALSIMKPILEKKAKGTSVYFDWQIRLFYAGIMFFIVWRVLEMYLA
jgi:hypothetical protein